MPNNFGQRCADLPKVARNGVVQEFGIAI